MVCFGERRLQEGETGKEFAFCPQKIEEIETVFCFQIATVVGNSIDFLFFVLSCLKMGIPLVPINPASKDGFLLIHII